MEYIIYDPLNHQVTKDQKNSTVLRTNYNNGNAWVILKSASMPSKSTKNTSQPIKSTAMSQISHGQMFQILNCFVGDSPANPFQSRANEAVSLIPEANSSLKSLGLHRKNIHAFYFLKTSRGFYLTTKAEPSRLFSIRWMNLGMTCNGKCLTLKTLVSPRTESGCSLSDILEPQVAPKYFLSDKQTKYIQRTITEKSQSALIPTTTRDGSITAKEQCSKK